MDYQLFKSILEGGISVGSFALCVWLVVKIVNRLCFSIDKLVSRMEVFCNRVREEHEQHSRHHENLMRQHEGMIEALGRINGYKKE